MLGTVAVIGAGIAGSEAACRLSEMGFTVFLIEKENEPGGKIRQWDKLFISKRPASEITEELKKDIAQNNVNFIGNAKIQSIRKEGKRYFILLSGQNEIMSDAILVSTGYDTFNATAKEEYGYGIYNNVITSVELEEKLSSHSPILTFRGKKPDRIGFIHCVGSRDEKVGNIYCSQLCCVTAVKQAISMRELFPRSEIYCFYMDMRMFGLRFEELYKESQAKWGVNYIRGRLSEACETMDGKIIVKVEDTLAGRPLKMKIDLMVLMVGFIPSSGTKELASLLNIPVNDNGFLNPVDEHLNTNLTSLPGIFIAGTCKGPKTVADTFADGRAVAVKISHYLKNL